MNTDSNTDPNTAGKQHAFAQAAAAYTPPEPQRHAVLMPHLESIAMLRSKGASYRDIVGILGMVEIRVSQDTLSRFCRETIERKPERGSRHRFSVAPVPRRAEAPPSEPPPPPPPAAPDSPAPAGPAEQTEPPPPPRGKGPRIADPSNI